MNPQAHWEKVYSTKKPTETSWFRPHLETSTRWIEHVAPDRSASILDAGGGESTLVDDLLTLGYRNLTVLDISQAAIDHAQQRLGPASHHVTWLAQDITQTRLPSETYGVWHDRAVFHFLTQREQRAAYIQQAASAVEPGGHILIGTFGLEGPEKCSGLDVMRYDAETLHAEFGPRFQPLESFHELHETPFGTTQQFLYCTFLRT
jgi:2-polyprenyl-3-methyl-5-hydroxy-6-metoxy-1,4-benzoquinol methylase